MIVRILLIVGILAHVASNALAQTATISNTSIACETQNNTPDKYVIWSGTWSGTWWYTVVGCYQPVYTWDHSPVTYQSPGAPVGAAAPTTDPGSSTGTETPIVPMSTADGDLKGAYVWFEYGYWDQSPYDNRWYWVGYAPLCDAVWIANTTGGCFAAGTMILTPGGYRPIESLKAGDSVISASRKTPDAEKTTRRVRSVSRHLDRLVDITAGGRTIQTTSKHPFFTRSKGWVSAGELQIGDELLGDTNRLSAVETVHLRTGAAESPVYNIEIDGQSSYFVGGAGWGFSFCVADSCSAPKSRTERPALTGKQGPHPASSISIDQILRERFIATREGR